MSSYPTGEDPGQFPGPIRVEPEPSTVFHQDTDGHTGPRSRRVPTREVRYTRFVRDDGYLSGWSHRRFRTPGTEPDPWDHGTGTPSRPRSRSGLTPRLESKSSLSSVAPDGTGGVTEVLSRDPSLPWIHPRSHSEEVPTSVHLYPPKDQNTRRHTETSIHRRHRHYWCTQVPTEGEREKTI